MSIFSLPSCLNTGRFKAGHVPSMLLRAVPWPGLFPLTVHCNDYPREIWGMLGSSWQETCLGSTEWVCCFICVSSSVPELWLSTFSRGMEAALGWGIMPSFGTGNPLIFGKRYPGSSQRHRFILNDSPSCTAPSPLQPTAVPKCSPLPKSHSNSFSIHGSNIYCSQGEEYPTHLLSALMLPGELLSHAGDDMCLPPPSRASSQGCLPCSWGSPRSCWNQRALPVAKFELPSGKLNKIMCSSPDVLTKSMMMLNKISPQDSS